MARELIAFALVLGLAVAPGGCKSGDAKQEPAGGPAASAQPPLASKVFYRVDGKPPAPCANGSVCEAGLVLTALGKYHVNPDYPFKFVADPAAAGPPLDGPGSFAIDGEKRGTLSIKFRPSAPGTARLVGTFKLSVCSEDHCEIETPRLELAVPVS